MSNKHTKKTVNASTAWQNIAKVSGERIRNRK